MIKNLNLAILFLLILIFYSCNEITNNKDKIITEKSNNIKNKKRSLDDLNLNEVEEQVIIKIIASLRENFSKGQTGYMSFSGTAMDNVKIKISDKDYIEPFIDYTYDNDGIFLNRTYGSYGVGVFRITGYVKKDSQKPALRNKNSFIFVVKKASEQALKFLKERDYTYDQKLNSYILYSTIPNEFDPGYTILNSDENNLIIASMLFTEIPARGGHPDNVRILSFQKESDLEKKYINPFDEDDYNNYDSGI